jgi:hypothetical protein
MGEEDAGWYTFSDDLCTEDQRTGGLGWGRQQCDAVQQSLIPTVHQEALVGQEVDSDEGMSDGHHESPRETWRNPRFSLSGSRP